MKKLDITFIPQISFLFTLCQKKFRLSFPIFMLLISVPSLSLAAPVIFYTDVVAGPNTGGENNSGVYLSIFGKGFGTSRGTSIVTINGVEVATYKQWGAPSMVSSSHGIQVITVQPGSKVSSGTIVVTVNGVASNNDHTFTVASGNIYYVAVNGNDSTAILSDVTHPWANPNTIIQRSDFNNGGVIVMRGGSYVYSSAYSLYFHAGNAGLSHVTVMGYPGETVTINRGITYFVTTGVQNHYVTISNIVFHTDNNSKPCGLLDSDHFRIINNECTGMNLTGSGDGAIAMFSSNNEIMGNYVHDNGSNKLYHAIYVANDFALNPDNDEIAYNHIANEKGGRGIQIYHGSGTVTFTNFKVHDNVIHDIALDGMLFGNLSGGGNIFYNNIVYRTGVASWQVDGNGGGCIRTDSTSLVLSAYNNTLYDCGVDLQPGSSALRLDNVGSLALQNNAIQVLGAEPYTYQAVPNSSITSSNNLWFGGGTPPKWDSNSINADPLFVDLSTLARNFQLQPLSPAIDAGVTTPATIDFNGVFRPQGGAFDIGAFEFCTVTCVTPKLVPPTAPVGLTVK